MEGEMRSRDICREAATEGDRRERNWEQDYGSRGERERAKQEGRKREREMEREQL